MGNGSSLLSTVYRLAPNTLPPMTPIAATAAHEKRGTATHSRLPSPVSRLTCSLGALLLCATSASAQWLNRYPKNTGFNHHVYLEGYELPVLFNGPVDAAPAPDGDGIVFASRGWLWRFDPASGVATRLTSGGGVDSRPAWSRDGAWIAFVRDDSRTLAVVVRNLATGEEREIDRGMALDPVFASDGKSLYYANATNGDLDLWRADLATGAKTRVTTEAGLELRPQLLPDGDRIVYMSKTRATGDQLRLRVLADGKETVLLGGGILSQTRPALSPDGRLVAYNWPGTNGWELRLTSVDRPGTSILLLARDRGRPIMPAWSRDGRWIYYSEADSQQVMHLMRIPSVGGRPGEVPVTNWKLPAPNGRLVIHTRGAASAPIAARLHVRDGSGHPAIPATSMPRFDGQNGLTYFYSSGTVSIELPAGSAEVHAARGLAAPEQVVRVDVVAGETRDVTLTLTPLWDARAAGWYSGDHHFHLNYGGQVDLAPRDLLPLLAGEDLDVATPMLANLHNRFDDQANFDWRSSGGRPLVRWAQEVRSHFLGHVGLLGTDTLFWPWVWGPGYEIYGRDDRLNAEPLREARRQGGAGLYVHPVTRPDPFTDSGLAAIPLELVADAAHGDVDLLEVVCLWSNSVGTTELWYRLLNAGFPVAPSGGTDVMTDFHRTMALGSTRVYVRPEGAFDFDSYLAGLKAGRSFVTTGPMVDLTVSGRHPGDVLPRAGGEVPFALTVASAVPVDSIALVVNGKTVWSGGGIDSSGTRSFTGKVRLPAGGWVAARIIGRSTTRWPAMAYHGFAHTAPIWIGSRASTEPNARRAAATDLLRALTVAEQRLVAGYAGSEIPRLRAHFAEARVVLERLGAGTGNRESGIGNREMGDVRR
jgi:TolB protein